MKFSMIFGLLLGVLLCSTAQAECVTLDKTPGAFVFVPHNGGEVAVETVPKINENGIRFAWDAHQTPYIEIGFKKPIPLPNAFKRAAVHARFWAPMGCTAQNMNVRFRDKDGEIMQFEKRVSFLKGGVFDIVWEIDPERAAGSWGCENLNRKIDFPAHLHAMTVSYSQEIPTGYCFLLDLSVETTEIEDKNQIANRVEAQRPVCSMDDACRFTKHWGNGDFACRDEKLCFENVTSRVGISERKFQIQRYETIPTALEFDTELLEGNASLMAVFVYADKAEYEADSTAFETPPVAIQEGRGRTILPLAETLKGAKFPVRLSRFDLIPAQNSVTKLNINAIQILQEESAAEAVDFDVVTDTRVHVLSVGKEDALRFRFTNRGNQTHDFLITMEYENFAGSKTTESFEKTLEAGEIWETAPQWRPDSLGHWNLRASIAEKTAPMHSSVKNRSLAWIHPSGPTPGRADGFLFSVCTHTKRWSLLDRQLEVEAAALCGVKVVREGIGWDEAEPQKGVWNWELTDEMVEMYKQNGLEMQMILCSPPSWAIPPEIAADKTRHSWKNYPANIEDWKNYVREVGRHYKGTIRFYENWNEPDLHGFSEMTLDQYVSLQKAFFEALTEADPEAVAMSGGFATLSRHSGLIYPEFQRDFLLKAKGAFHVHAIHEHGWFDGYRQRIDDLFMGIRRETNTTVPWYSNETAMTSVGGYEKKQAECLFKKLLFAWVRGSIGYTWYDLRNDGYDPRYGEHHFGMVTNDFYPKEVYSVYNMLTSCYSSMKSAQDISPDEKIWIFRFSDGKDLLIPCWTESPFLETRYFLVETDAKSAKEVDLMGNETSVEIQNSRLIFPVTPQPKTLKLEGAAQCRFIEMVHAEPLDDIVPNRTSTVTLSLCNPFDRKVTFTLTPSVSIPGLKFDETPKSVCVLPQKDVFLPQNGTDLPQKKDVLPQGNTALPQGDAALPQNDAALPQEKAVFQLEITGSREFLRTSILPILYQLEGMSWSGIVFVPIKPAYEFNSDFNSDFSSAMEPATPPTFDLKRQNQITPLTPADPSNAHRLWKGTEDLSGTVQFAAARDVIRVRAEVYDDCETLSESLPNALSGTVGDQVRLYFRTDEGRFAEIALVKLASGKTCVQRILPEAQELTDAPLEVTHEGTRTLYEASIPWKNLELGRTPEILSERGVRISAAVGDDDGEGMDSWMHPDLWMPTSETMNQAPRFLFLSKESDN